MTVKEINENVKELCTLYDEIIESLESVANAYDRLGIETTEEEREDLYKIARSSPNYVRLRTLYHDKRKAFKKELIESGFTPAVAGILSHGTNNSWSDCED